MISRGRRRTPRAKGTTSAQTLMTQPGLTSPLVATAVLAALVATLEWPRQWLSSGCALETLAILYGDGIGSRILSRVPVWTLLASLNLIYAICSTSWLLLFVFTVIIYPCIGITCLFQFTFASNAARKWLRKVLKQLHFTRDKIALFNLPALEINTEVDGLLVIRGLTIELSSLTVVAHGIELGTITPCRILTLADIFRIKALSRRRAGSSRRQGRHTFPSRNRGRRCIWQRQGRERDDFRRGRDGI
jgi:hypothetical protein